MKLSAMGQNWQTPTARHVVSRRRRGCMYQG